jgi:hypothetical protein
MKTEGKPKASVKVPQDRQAMQNEAEARVRQGAVRESITDKVKRFFGFKQQGLGTVGIILVILVLILLFGAWPAWPYSQPWGYGPSGLFGVILVVVIVLLIMGRL